MAKAHINELPRQAAIAKIRGGWAAKSTRTRNTRFTNRKKQGNKHACRGSLDFS